MVRLKLKQTLNKELKTSFVAFKRPSLIHWIAFRLLNVGRSKIYHQKNNTK